MTQEKFTLREGLILAGNIAEHYNNSIYIFLAPVISSLFFPNSDPVISLIYSYSILSVNIITKPLGAYIFALIARKYGANSAISGALTISGIFTIFMALIPKYSQIGMVAPLSLTMAYFILTASSSGYANISKLYIIEHAKGKIASRLSYLYQASIIIGIIFASISASYVISYEFGDYWRICFLLGGLSLFIGYLAKKYLLNQELETKNHISASPTNIMDFILKYKKLFIGIFFVTGFSHLTYIVPFVIMNHLVPLISEVTIKEMMHINNIMLIMDLCMIVVIGEISSCFCAKKIMKYASFVMFITIMPLWYFLQNATILYVSFVRIWIVIIGILYLCPLNIWINQQVRAVDKYVISGISSSLSSVLIGKITPFISIFIYHYFSSFFTVSIYISFLSFMSYLSIKATDSHPS